MLHHTLLLGRITHFGNFGSQFILTLFGLDLALKDVRLGMEMARAWGLNLPAMEATLENYKKASAAGFGKEDCNAIYKVIGK